MTEATYLLLMLDCCFLAESASIKDLADEAEGVKILCRREDVRAGSVLSNSDDLLGEAFMLLALLSKFSHWGQGLATCAQVENEMEYGNILRRFDCNLEHVWRCTPGKVRNSYYSQCYQDSYTGHRAWRRVHKLRTRMEYAVKS